MWVEMDVRSARKLASQPSASLGLTVALRISRLQAAQQAKIVRRHFLADFFSLVNLSRSLAAGIATGLLRPLNSYAWPICHLLPGNLKSNPDDPILKRRPTLQDGRHLRPSCLYGAFPPDVRQ
jgi:hypothetical protein